MPIDIYVEYTLHDGQPVWTLQPERLEYSFQLGSQGPSTMSHFVPLSEPTLTRSIVAPKRNDYMLKWTNDGAQTFLDLQGGFLWDAGFDSEEFGVQFAGVDWSAWLDNPFPQDREISQGALLADKDLLTAAFIGLPTSAYDWENNGNGVNQKVIIGDLIAALEDGPDAIAFSVSFSGSNWVNVPGELEGLPGGETFTIGPFDVSPVRQHIANISTLNDPWVPNFRCGPDKSLDFFFMKNKDPGLDIVPDFLVSDETVIHHIDWGHHGPIATYVTGWGVGSMPKWFTSRDIESEEKFRRWRSSHTLGSRGQVYLTREQIKKGTLAFADKFPQKDLTLVIYPDKLDPINEETGFLNLCGYVIDVDYFIDPVYMIFGVFYIISQNFHVDVAGNWLCDLGLQQIYQF